MSGEDSQRIRATFGQVDLDLDEDPRSTKPRLLLVNEAESVRTIPGAPALVLEEETTAIATASPALLERMRHPPSSKELTARVATGAVAEEDPRIGAMRDLYASGDADAALFIATAVQATSNRPPPMRGADDGEVEVSVGSERSIELDFTLDEAYERTAGGGPQSSRSGLAGIPKLLVGTAELSKMPLEPRAAFLVMHVDGTTSVGEILEICGMSKAEATTLFRQLLALGVIAVTRR